MEECEFGNDESVYVFSRVCRCVCSSIFPSESMDHPHGVGGPCVGLDYRSKSQTALRLRDHVSGNPDPREKREYYRPVG